MCEFLFLLHKEFIMIVERILIEQLEIFFDEAVKEMIRNTEN